MRTTLIWNRDTDNHPEEGQQRWSAHLLTFRGLPVDPDELEKLANTLTILPANERQIRAMELKAKERILARHSIEKWFDLRKRWYQRRSMGAIALSK